MAPDLRALLDTIRSETTVLQELRDSLSQVVVGQRRMMDRLLIGLLSGGHVLLEGVPGLAKTLTVRALAQSLGLSFSRLQFTPDLLPADLTGAMVYDPRSQSFVSRKGPVFAHLVLADEVNRAPAKVQSALLEAMQEKQVTIGDETYPLPQPFLVMATQNPVEQEGTYPLPEAQQDRFMLHVEVDYPTREEERALLDRPPPDPATLGTILEAEGLTRLKALARRIHCDARIKDYIIDVVWATRRPGDVGLSNMEGLIELGASPRATLALEAGARAHALLQGRPAVFPEDVKAVGLNVLRHRIKRTFEAEAENVAVADLVRRIFDAVRVP
ncbi:MAG: AAA family ATPase [Myxococcota bacterium]